MNSLKDIKGIGSKIEAYLNSLGIFTPRDLLYYYPRDYEEFSKIYKICELEIGNTYAIDAIVVSKPVSFGNRNLKITKVMLDDGSGRISALWFNSPFINKQLIVGKRAVFRGKVSSSNGTKSLTQCKIYNPDVYESLKGILNPIYPLTKGLSNVTMRKSIKALLQSYESYLTEYLPDKLISENELCDLKTAINSIHFPKNYEEMIVARRRLVYDELFIFSLALHLKENQNIKYGIVEFKNIDVKLIYDMINCLEYKLTDGQIATIKEIINDYENIKKVNRLIEGDVGSGKTVIAMLISLVIASMGGQVAFMAPTEILAEQHYNSFLSFLNNSKFKKLGLNINIAILTGSTKTKERNEILKLLESNSINIIIGTHALYSADVIYNNLSLCIIDEQHKFGVNQRNALLMKGDNVGLIVMSATPIPRTLAMLLYADSDISIIKDKPGDRLPIKNMIIGKEDRNKAYISIKKQIDMGHQAYIVCPAIDKNDEDGSFANYENVVEYEAKIKKIFGPKVNIEILHGKMDSSKKDEIMNSFKNKEIDILVSTTVVEVGVDVPNATFIMIENAGAFGLSELHQLRGRVGRGENQSFAVFVDTMNTDKTKERLDIVCHSNDGFFIADEDLRLRGPGDIFGVKQSGETTFRIADIYTDIGIFRKASADAKEFINKKYEINEELKSELDMYLSNSNTL